MPPVVFVPTSNPGAKRWPAERRIVPGAAADGSFDRSLCTSAHTYSGRPCLIHAWTCAATRPLHLDNSFKFENIKETTNENTTAHCSVPMLRRPSDEAGPSPWWCCAELAQPPWLLPPAAAVQSPTQLPTHPSSVLRTVHTHTGREWTNGGRPRVSLFAEMATEGIKMAGINNGDG